MPSLVEYTVEKVHSDNSTHLECTSNGVPQTFSVVYSFFLLFGAYIIPQIILYTHYGKLLCFVWQRGKIVFPSPNKNQLRNVKIDNLTTRGAHSGNGVTLNTSAVSKNKMRIVKMLIIVATFFSLAWMPYFVLLVIEVS